VEQDSERARQTGHSTARQAAELARAAQVRLLALVHVSTRYFVADVKREARAAFPEAQVPRDFDTIEVPFPERGAAQLIRWSDRPRVGESVVSTEAVVDSESTDPQAVASR
jgi:ribonuclease Z